MDSKTFGLLVDERFARCHNTLVEKGEEYATKDDRLHNFREAAKLRKTTLSSSCLGMGLKHIISVCDLVDSLTNRNAFISDEIINEKFGDTINYLLLLEACIIEERNEDNGSKAHSRKTAT